MSPRHPKGVLRNELKSLFLRRYVLSADDARALLAKEGLRTSLVSIYAELKLLIAGKVIIKKGKRYILSLAWLLEARSSIEAVYRGLLSSSHALSACGIDEEELCFAPRRWVLPSLYQANQVWVQLIFALLARSSSRQVFEYVPRLWFAYIEEAQDTQFQRTFKAVRADIRIIVGGHSALDRAPFYRKGRPPAYCCLYEAAPDFGERNLCLCVIDEYLITIRYSKRIAVSMDALFTASVVKKQQALSGLLQLLLQKERVVLSLERATSRAHRLGASFRRQDFSRAMGHSHHGSAPMERHGLLTKKNQR